MVTRDWSREDVTLLDRLNFDPEFIERARGNLFLLGLEKRDRFAFKIDGKAISVALPHFYGPNLKGSTERVYIPIQFIPVLHQIPTALATIGHDDPLSQNTILRQSIQDMGDLERSYVQDFIKSFDCHPSIKFAEILAEIIAECLDVPFRPYRGDDHVARSKMYQDIHMIDGQFYVEFGQSIFKAPMEVFARAFDKVQKIEQQSRLLPRSLKEVKGSLVSLKDRFSNPKTEIPSDFEFWRDLFHGRYDQGEYSFRPDHLLEDHKLYEDALDPEAFVR